MGWFGFWIFLAVLVCCDCFIFYSGYDSYFHIHKTDAEKELQKIKIDKARADLARERGWDGKRRER